MAQVIRTGIIDGHAIAVKANSLYYATGLAIARFRNCGPGPASTFTIVPHEPAVEHVVVVAALPRLA